MGLRSLDVKCLKNEIGDFETIILISLAIYYTKYEAKVLYVIFIDIFIFILNWKKAPQQPVYTLFPHPLLFIV